MAQSGKRLPKTKLKSQGDRSPPTRILGLTVSLASAQETREQVVG